MCTTFMLGGECSAGIGEEYSIPCYQPQRDGENFPVGMDIPNDCMEGLENFTAGMDIRNY